MSKLIPLTRGKSAIVDDADFEYLSRWKWHCSAHGYAVRGVRRGGVVVKIWMHREVVKVLPGQLVDHKNGDKLDNRRSNLRKATFAENQHNRSAYTSNTTGYKGVTQQKGGKYSAQISRAGIHYHLGTFDTPELAHEAYKEAAEVYHGNFARHG